MDDGNADNARRLEETAITIERFRGSPSSHPSRLYPSKEGLRVPHFDREAEHVAQAALIDLRALGTEHRLGEVEQRLRELAARSQRANQVDVGERLAKLINFRARGEAAQDRTLEAASVRVGSPEP